MKWNAKKMNWLIFLTLYHCLPLHWCRLKPVWATPKSSVCSWLTSFSWDSDGRTLVSTLPAWWAYLKIRSIIILHQKLIWCFLTIFVDVDTDKLRKMLTLTEVDLQDNPLTTETADKLRDIDVFTVQVGESDPAGKQLDNVEWWWLPVVDQIPCAKTFRSPLLIFCMFLAHLSRRLTRWAYSIAMVRRPSVVVVVHTFKPVYLWSQLANLLGRIRLLTLELLALEWRKLYTFELEYLWDKSANLDQIVCVASLGVGKGCIMFWGRLAENSGAHGNRKLPLTYNGENGVSTFSRLLLIRSFLYLQVISDKFEFRPGRTTDYGVSCPWASKKFPIDL